MQPMKEIVKLLLISSLCLTTPGLSTEVRQPHNPFEDRNDRDRKRGEEERRRREEERKKQNQPKGSLLAAKHGPSIAEPVCPIQWDENDSLEVTKIKIALIKAWRAEQNAKTIAVYFGDSRLVWVPVGNGLGEIRPEYYDDYRA
jgi:hypothetical protein